MSSGSQRVRRGLATVFVLGAVFTAGVAVGWSEQPGQRRTVPSGSVIDEAVGRITSESAKPVNQGELERAAVDGMLKSLGDRWASFYPPSEFTGFQRPVGGYSGVGLWLYREADGRLEVSNVQADAPAAAAGIRCGDELRSVGGRSVAGLGVTDVAAMLRGAAGTTVTLGVERGESLRTVVLRRSALPDDDVQVDRDASGITRIRIAAFTRGVGREVRDAARQASAASGSGVVLDLRDNPGGLLDEAVEVASVFLPGGPVVSYDDHGRRQTLDASGDGDVKTPLVVLVNGGTASAAEVVTGALQDRGRAVVVGVRTYGKGTVQAPSTLSDGSTLELTVGHYLTPSGRRIDGVGIEPDITVSADATPEQAQRRAYQVLTGLLAALGSGGRG